MKILVYSNVFEVGGTQINIVDLSLALQNDFGHEVVIFAPPGAMSEIARSKGLRILDAPRRTRDPSTEMARAFWKIARNEQPDLIQTWEWPPCLEAYYTSHLVDGTPMLAVVMESHQIQRFFPKSIASTFGTPEFVDMARAAGRRSAHLLLPPVDTAQNSPETVDPQHFRAQHGLRDDELVLVTVSRLAKFMKSESLVEMIGAVRELGNQSPVRLVIVGDGEVRGLLERLAGEANSALGRTAVILTGELLDPRPAYAAADIVIGMGSSALRGAAFGKPVIVVGTKGFSARLTPETGQYFHYRGIYGVGEGIPRSSRLIDNIRAFASAKDDLPEFGSFARDFVEKNFSIASVAAQLDAHCRTAVQRRRNLPIAIADAARTAFLLKFGRFTPKAVRIYLRGREALTNPIQDGLMAQASDRSE